MNFPRARARKSRGLSRAVPRKCCNNSMSFFGRFVSILGKFFPGREEIKAFQDTAKTPNPVATPLPPLNQAPLKRLRKIIGGAARAPALVSAEIKAPQKMLVECLEKVIGATVARTTASVHAYILLRPNDAGGLSMTAANSEFQIRADCAVVSPPKLLATLPARKFMDILRLLPPREPVSISVRKDRAIVSAGNFKFTLMTENPDEFTLIDGKPDKKEERRIVSYRFAATAQFLEALKMVYYAAAQKHSHRQYFNGVLLEFEPGAEGVALAATDGNRLAINRVSAELLSDELQSAQKIGKPFFDRLKSEKKARKEHATDAADAADADSGKLEAIMSRESVGEILRNMDLCPNLGLEIDLSQRYARFRMPGYELITKVIGEAYPDYRGVIPHNNEKIIVFEREKFLEKLTRVSALCDKEINNAVIFNLSKGRVKMRCENRSGEESASETSVSYEGDDLEIGFNFQLLKEMLDAVEFPAMRMFVRDASGSVLFEPVQEEVEESAKSEFRYIIMPIRL